MLSEQTLAHNLAALERAQGMRPGLSGLDAATTRVAEDASLGVRIDIRRADGSWTSLDDDAVTGRLADTLRGARQAIVIGPGLGYLLDAMETAGATTKVLAIEPDPGLAVLFLARRDWQPWLNAGRLRLLTGPDYQGAVTAARFLDAMVPTVVCVNPIVEEHRPEAAAGARRVADIVQANAESNAIARRNFAGRYLLQTLTNLPVVAREGDAAALDGLFAGTPAVVVGAGPSLDANLPALAACQDSAVIIAADTTLRPLLAGGVRPHLVVAVDPSELNARHLAGVEHLDGIAFAAEGSLHPTAYEGFRGRTFVFKVSNHEPWSWLSESGIERGTVRAWGSVVTSAFDLVLRMGCNPVVFAGLDLAYTGMRPYCRNTIYDTVWQSYVDAGCTWQQLMDDYFSRQPDVRRTDVHGAEVRTAPQLVSFRDWLVEQMAAQPARRFVNATGGGILRGKGIEQSTLAAVLGDAPAIPGMRERLQQAHAASSGRNAPLEKVLRRLATGPAAAAGSPLIRRWVDFTAGSVDPVQLEQHVRGLAV